MKVVYTLYITGLNTLFNHKISVIRNVFVYVLYLSNKSLPRYGMSEEFGMMALATQQHAYLGGDASLTCSETTAAKIDAEVQKIIAGSYETAKKLLTENMDKLHELAKYLLEKETITGEEFMSILSARH